MIKRYSRKELTDIWSEENKYKIWLDVEIAAAQAMEKLNQIPKGVSSTVRKKARINVKRIHQIESQVKHDVIAFLTSVTEKAGLKARYLHQGMTSSDVLDTSFNIQLVQSGKILVKDLDQILKILKKQARKYKFTPCMGRSHGIHAEPITFGLKLASFYEEFKRNKKRLIYAIDEVSTCAISGAVGTFANISPKVEQHVAKKLGLKVEPISTQIIPRDRHAFYFSVLGIIAGSIERVATEIRHLQRTEVYELQEYFSKNQKGSSAMPHKKNPIQVCHLLDNDNRKISEIMDELPKTFQSPTMAPFCKDNEKYEVVNQLVKEIENIKNNKTKIDQQEIIEIITVNGVRFSFNDGSWGLIRASSNKPSLVVVTESPTSDERKKKIFEFIDQLLQKTGKIGEYDQKL